MAEAILWKFIEKILDRVNTETFWDKYGDALIDKIVAKLFP